MPEPQYHLNELQIALDPSRPEYIMPVLSSARVGVVDVGCGIGQLFVAKGDEIASGVSRYGFDIDATAIAYASERWPERATFAVAPAEQLPLPDGSVDFYVSRVTLPLANIRLALAEAARVLVPGGRLWITLHPITMTFGQMGRAVRRGRVKELVMRSIVLVNGLQFHLSGSGRRMLGIRDSWQSESRMRRELEPWFRDVRVTVKRHFLIDAASAVRRVPSRERPGLLSLGCTLRTPAAFLMASVETTTVPGPLTQLSSEEGLFRDAVAAFAEAEVRPRVSEMEKAAHIDAALVRGAFELGLMGLEVDEQYGGSGGTMMMVTLAVEAISRVDASSAIVVDVQNTLVNYPIARYGSDAQKSRYLSKLTTDTVGAYALSEPSSGSDAFGLQTRAEQRGDHWILNGRKMWITNGAEAGIFVVFANVDPAAGYHGITAFIVERGFKGFTVGRKEDKLGIRASSTTELILDGCEVPAANVLGPVGHGYKIAIDTLNGGRVGIGAQMIGIARGALDAALDYVKERHQFGKSIADFQGIQFQLAQAATELEAARLLVYNAARLRDTGREVMKEGAMAKLFSSQVCERVTSLCVELFGGYGYTKDFPVEKFYRDAKIGTIYEGTSNMQLHTIAKQLLK